MSQSLVYFAFIVPLLGIAFWLLIAWAGAKTILSMESIALERLPETESRSILARMLADDFVDPRWLEDHSYEPLGVFRQGVIDLAVWQRKQERTYLAIYLVLNSRRFVDIETFFDKLGGLVTGSSSDVQIFPPLPGQWKQSFSINQVAELHKLHEAGLKFLNDRTGVCPGQRRVAVEDEILNTERDKCKFVRTIPLWFLRVPYWHFVRRHRLHGKSVEYQYENRFSMNIVRHGMI